MILQSAPGIPLKGTKGDLLIKIPPSLPFTKGGAGVVLIQGNEDGCGSNELL